MAFDLQEQEQIAQLKGLWNDWGKSALIAALVVLAAWGAYTGYNAWQDSKAEGAADLYSQLQADLPTDPTKSPDAVKVRADADKMKQSYADSGLTARATLLAAKASARAGDLKSAQTELQWVVDHAKEVEMRDAARLRMAAVLLDQKSYDDAVKALSGREGEANAGLFAEARGDVFAAKGDNNAARDAYKEALAKLAKDAPNAQFVTVKLEALGTA